MSHKREVQDDLKRLRDALDKVFNLESSLEKLKAENEELKKRVEESNNINYCACDDTKNIVCMPHQASDIWRNKFLELQYQLSEAVEALGKIVKHHEYVAGTMAVNSTVCNIAKAFLAKWREGNG